MTIIIIGMPMVESAISVVLQMVALLMNSAIDTVVKLIALLFSFMDSMGLVMGSGLGGIFLGVLVIGIVLFFIAKFVLASGKSVMVLAAAWDYPAGIDSAWADSILKQPINQPSGLAAHLPSLSSLSSLPSSFSAGLTLGICSGGGS